MYYTDHKLYLTTVEASYAAVCYFQRHHRKSVYCIETAQRLYTKCNDGHNNSRNELSQLKL